MRFVRAGTLDQPALCPPDVHIFTASKQPWIVLPKGVPAYEKAYPRKEDVWSKECLERLAVFNEKVRIWEVRKAEEGGTNDP